MTFEYYDIPFRYNETCIKLLFQNPFILFVFWDISNEDEKKYIDNYGQEAYDNSSLFLKVFNISKGYDFEINIDPFAKTWYINNVEPNCKYRAELFRKINNTPVFVTTSNELNVPTDRPNNIYNYEFRFVNSEDNQIHYVRNSRNEIQVINNNFYNDFEDIEITKDRFNKKKNILNNPSSFSNISSGEKYFRS